MYTDTGFEDSYGVYVNGKIIVPLMATSCCSIKLDRQTFTGSKWHFNVASFNLILTRKPVKESLAIGADPDQTPHQMASDQGLLCLLTGFP